MKKNSNTNLILVLLVFLFISCSHWKDESETWSKEKTISVLDSIDISKLLAAFNEDGGYSVMVISQNNKNKIVKFTRWENGSFLIDTLSYVSENKFKSKFRPRTYSVNDSSVIVIHDQKIIHPSSNWQGQTPWRERNLWTYKRIDWRGKSKSN